VWIVYRKLSVRSSARRHKHDQLCVSARTWLLAKIKILYFAAMSVFFVGYGVLCRRPVEKKGVGARDGAIAHHVHKAGCFEARVFQLSGYPVVLLCVRVLNKNVLEVVCEAATGAQLSSSFWTKVVYRLEGQR